MGPTTGPINGPRKNKPMALPRSWIKKRSVIVLHETSVSDNNQRGKTKCFDLFSCVTLHRRPVLHWRRSIGIRAS